MIIVGVGVWACGAAACLLLALGSPGTWPYTKGGYASERGRMLRRFWAGRIAVAVLWPAVVISIGVKVLVEELT